MPTNDFETELRHCLERVRAATGVTGIAVGVVADGQSFTATGGVGNAELGRPLTAATLFQVGSISKTVAAATLVRLHDEGRLDLDDQVARHLPDLDRQAPDLCLTETTIAHLLTHASGFDGDHLLTRREGNDVGRLADATRLFPPGHGYSYSNAGFTLVGCVIERLTGRSYRRAATDLVLRPLGMRRAAFRADEVVTDDVAAPHWVHDDRSYVIRNAGWQPGWELEPLDHAPGGLIASVDDLLRWSRFQLDGLADDGTELLGASSLADLHTPRVDAGNGVAIGLDWFIRSIDGTTVFGHGGTTAGYCSDLVVVPSARVALVVLTNATNGGRAIVPIRRWVLERFADLVETDPTPDPHATTSVEAVAGRYLHPFGILTVEPDELFGQVVLTTAPRTDVVWQPPADPPVTLGCVDRQTWVGVADGPKPIATFGFDTDGRSAWVNWHERRAPRID